jgi:hypothetical protein
MENDCNVQNVSISTSSFASVFHQCSISLYVLVLFFFGSYVEVTNANLDPKANYSDLNFLWFSSHIPTK